MTEVRQSILRKLASNAEAMTQAELQLERTKQRQAELVNELRNLPPALPHTENI